MCCSFKRASCAKQPATWLYISWLRRRLWSLRTSTGTKSTLFLALLVPLPLPISTSSTRTSLAQLASSSKSRQAQAKRLSKSSNAQTKAKPSAFSCAVPMDLSSRRQIALFMTLSVSCAPSLKSVRSSLVARVSKWRSHISFRNTHVRFLDPTPMFAAHTERRSS